MAFTPLVLVTSTTESNDGRSRVVLNEAYTSALVAAGLLPLVLPPIGAIIAVASLAGVAGLVLTGGEDIDPQFYGQEPHAAAGEPHKTRDAYEIALAKAARERRMPTLAICRGAQIVCIAAGGTLVQDIQPPHPGGVARVHDVVLDAGSRLAAILGASAITVNSSHHQAIDQPGTGIRVVGRGPGGVVEAVESTDAAWWMMGVQWHAEDLADTVEDWDRRLFLAFAHEVRGAGRD